MITKNDDSGTDVPHTAITTGSGFVYQGKVAIYHVISLLNNGNNCTEYKLQLDSLEDFSILDGADTLISLHQVKALKTQYYSSYVKAFNLLKSNSEKYGCANAQFHLAREITDKTPAEILANHPPVEIYKYGADSWCSVDEIDRNIEEQIKILLATYFVDDISKHTSDYASKARSYIDQIILKKTLEIHRIVHDNLMSDREAAYTQIIQFKEIIDTLREDLNQKDLGDEYYFFMLINDFHRYYQEFCIEHDELNEEQLIKLSLCMKEIGALEHEGMVQFICNIMPHRVFKFKTLEDFKDSSFSKDEIKDGFLTILNNLKQTELQPNSIFQWRVGEEFFTPTTIDKGDSHARGVCRKIIENAKNSDLDVMYEGSNLITTDIDVDSITANVPDLITNVDSDGRESERVSRWKKVSLVSLEKASALIND